MIAVKLKDARKSHQELSGELCVDFEEPEQSRKIVNICRERDFEVIMGDSCIGCGLCVNACSMKAIKLESLTAHADSIQCCGCQLCEDECPTDSIKILEIEND